MSTATLNRKQQYYIDTVLGQLKEQFNYSNNMAVPKLSKIILNRGINAEEAKSGQVVEQLIEDLTLIAGQKAVMRKAKKSIATFKIREGMPNGATVTLRAVRMWAFLDKLVSVYSPRIRDFRGFKCKGDGLGNFTIGITDQRVFSEVENRQNKGLNITFVTTANSDEEGKALLTALGFPFVK